MSEQCITKKYGNVILDNRFFFNMENSRPNSERNMACTVKEYTISVIQNEIVQIH